MSRLLKIPHNVLEILSKSRRFLLSYTVYTQSMKQRVVKYYQLKILQYSLDYNIHLSRFCFFKRKKKKDIYTLHSYELQ